MDATMTRAKQRIQALAQDYRRRGYTVVEAPSPGDLPDFLVGYQPDLLIHKGQEALVVVVRSRATLAHDPQVRELARVVQARPDWNFELVVVGGEEPGQAPEGARPFTRAEIVRGMAEAERLLEAGFAEVALLRAWSASEATVRLLTEEEGFVLDRFTSHAVLKKAVMHGVMAREEYHFLTRVLPYRNAIIHGFTTQEFDPKLVEELLSMTKHMLQAVPTP